MKLGERRSGDWEKIPDSTVREIVDNKSGYPLLETATVHLTNAQRRLVARAASAAGLTVGEFMRRAVLASTQQVIRERSGLLRVE